jgi:cobalt/nickel transport system ATP-binding protein
VMHRGRFVLEGKVAEIFEQPDLLRSMRLDVPVLPKLLGSLRKSGIPVPMAYTYEDAEKALLQAFRGKE